MSSVQQQQQEFYEVEKILNERTNGNKLEYLVKWKGYDESQNSWEPFENLKHLTFLFEEFKNTKKITEKV